MIAFLRRAALDVITVACLIGLAVVVTLWARSYTRHDALTSYFDDPPPPNWLAVPMEKRAAWRERVTWLLPGRFAFASVSTRVVERQLGPIARLHRSDLRRRNGWTFGSSGVAYGWPESAPPPPAQRWHGFGGWRVGKTDDLQVARPDYREIRRVEGWCVAAPYWLPAAVLAAMPVGRAWIAVCRRRKAGDCGSAGRGAPHLLGRAFTALSLLLFVVVIALWVRSHWITHVVDSHSFAVDADQGWSLSVRSQYHSTRGVISILRLESRNPSAAGGSPPLESHGLSYGPPGGRSLYARGTSSPRRWLDWAGVRISRSTVAPAQTEWAARIPYRVIAVLLALPPAARAGIIAWRWLRRRRRFAAGHCQSCGYDLRGGHDRCPECGAGMTDPGIAGERKGREVPA